MKGWESRLLAAYSARCDWFQPLDCSLPGDTIHADTPMHFGPAIFNLITGQRMLDLAEDLIGPEITSNPIQHIRIKPLPPISAAMRYAHILPQQTGIKTALSP